SLSKLLWSSGDPGRLLSHLIFHILKNFIASGVFWNAIAPPVTFKRTLARRGLILFTGLSHQPTSQLPSSLIGPLITESTSIHRTVRSCSTRRSSMYVGLYAQWARYVPHGSIRRIS